ncbi:hypothetical protein B0H14DRAFT_3129786 [Mycena olivaceomarginata]|nr:hypothetical protein B0H14DRAFT_3129786 [Mycena olivaceomarginata]
MPAPGKYITYLEKVDTYDQAQGHLWTYSQPQASGDDCVPGRKFAHQVFQLFDNTPMVWPDVQDLQPSGRARRRESNYGVAQYILKAGVLYATTRHVPKGLG